jgi:predicted ATP-binding protein involved in virulence
MKEMQEIHENVLKMLERCRKKDSNLFFTLRQTNRYNRLEKGYWFHGNDDYLAVSFWSGRDWMNKTPNIYFEIKRNKQCLFIFSAKDSRFKAKFAEEKILPLFQKEIELQIANNVKIVSNYVLAFSLGEGDYEYILKNFIEQLKPKIDALIRQNEADYEVGFEHAKEYDLLYEFKERDDSSPIDFISFQDFNKNYKKIKKYRRRLILSHLNSFNEFYLKEIRILDAGDIREEIILNIPKETQWVFLTGENGCGKTTILKAITAFFNKEIKDKYNVVSSSTVKISSHSKEDNPDLLAFAAYGQSRLLSSSCKLNLSDDELIQKSLPWYSIFNPDGILRGLDDIRNVTSPQYENKLIDIINFLREMFNQKEDSISNDSTSELIPQLAEVDFSNLMGVGEILYREKDSSNIPYKELTKFEDLASGIRSLLALVADLIIRLVERNPEEPDPSNFKAVVLIDEIDIHFHPSMQKKIIEVLTGNFPKVQFIATTHSPVTLLGAPENSVFYKVSRNAEHGVTVENFDIDISNLLPNTILSSPLFGFHDLFPVTHIPEVKIRTETLYADIVKNDELRLRLKKIAAKLRDKR